MTKYKVEEHRNDVTIFLSLFFPSPCFVLTLSHFGSRSLLTKGTSLPSRRTSASRESDSASLHGIPKRPTRKEPSHVFRPLFAFLKSFLTQPRNTAQPGVVTNNTLRIYYTKQNNSPAMCVCARVCAVVHRGPSGSRRSKKQEAASSTIGQIWEGRLSQKARTLTHLWVSVSNQPRLFFFLLQMIFSHTYAHTHSPVHYFSVGWMNGQKDRRTKDGQRAKDYHRS